MYLAAVILQDGASNNSYTYNDLRNLSKQFGLALRSQWSWEKGHVLVLMSPNCTETPLVTWGCHYNGGVVAPVNPGLSPRDLEQQLLRSQAKGIVVHPSCLSTALEAAKLANLPSERVLVLGETSGNNRLATVDQFIQSLGEASLTESQPVDVTPDDVAFLVYSSGTTGLPKGVMVSHRNVVADVVLQASIEGPHVSWTKDRTLAVLPTYHIYGKSLLTVKFLVADRVGLICLVHLPVWLGTTTIFMEKFDLQTFCWLIREYAISHVYVAPPVVLHLAKSRTINQSDLASLRMITSGGAPLGAALIHETYNRWKIPVRQAYGLSETTSVSHIQVPYSSPRVS
jgi:acyl-CoA synthetase (AMP-forming)/AMP-acid ligase II